MVSWKHNFELQSIKSGSLPPHSSMRALVSSMIMSSAFMFFCTHTRG